VFRRAATPRSFAHYTLRGHGVVGGVRNDRRHALLGAQSYRSGVPGLYLCGDSVFPGQGTIGVTLSGINAWRSVRDDLGARRSTAGERAHTLARLDPGDSRSTRRITPDAERGARVA